jgi:arginase family enzyme
VVRQAIEHNFTPIVIGGDHSLAIGSVDGSAAALSKLNSEIGLRKNFTYNNFKKNI